MKPHEIVRIGMARSFQKVNVFPRKTSFENVQVALIANHKLQFNPFRAAAGLFGEEIMQLLEQVRLGGDSGRRAGELPMASRNSWNWPWHWRRTRKSCCWTNPPPACQPPKPCPASR